MAVLMGAFDDWMIHRCSVDTPSGQTDAWGEAVVVTHDDVPCAVEETTQMVRDASGDEVQASTLVHLYERHAAWFPLGATVRLRDRQSEVISRAVVPAEDDPDLAGVTVALR